MTTTVVNLRDKPKGYVRIDRATIWGNPFIMKLESDREQVIKDYEEYLLNSPRLLEHLDLLKDQALACWCSPKPCHGDVLARYADGITTP